VLAEELTHEPWWLRRLLIASSPCGPGFFHEVGAKLLVEIGPEGGRRHNSPLIIPLSSEGKQPEAPSEMSRETSVHLLPSLPLLMLLTACFYLNYFYYYETAKGKAKHLANRKPKDKLEPSALSSHYCVSVLLQGVHYL
jgi:hypothetical protein